MTDTPYQSMIDDAHLARQLTENDEVASMRDQLVDHLAQLALDLSDLKRIEGGPVTLPPPQLNDLWRRRRLCMQARAEIESGKRRCERVLRELRAERLDREEEAGIRGIQIVLDSDDSDPVMLDKIEVIVEGFFEHLAAH